MKRSQLDARDLTQGVYITDFCLACGFRNKTALFLAIEASFRFTLDQSNDKKRWHVRFKMVSFRGRAAPRLVSCCMFNSNFPMTSLTFLHGIPPGTTKLLHVVK